VLHIATHGYFWNEISTRTGKRGRSEAGDASPLAGLVAELDEPLLRSGLALAGANRCLAVSRPESGPDDGLLTAAEILDIDLSATELVVLSTCDSGLGDVQDGEGVLGLRRSFQIAGARTVITNLWKMPDDVGHVLMRSFYEALVRGVPRAEALRSAQRKVRSEDDRLVSWAGFVCHGERGPLLRRGVA
jgi:CHAT domain-containing protein